MHVTIEASFFWTSRIVFQGKPKIALLDETPLYKVNDDNFENGSHIYIYIYIYALYRSVSIGIFILMHGLATHGWSWNAHQTGGEGIDTVQTIHAATHGPLFRAFAEGYLGVAIAGGALPYPPAGLP